MFLARQHQLADGGLAGLLQGFEQEGVRLVGRLLRSHVVGAVVVHRVDLFDVDERDDVDSAPALDGDALELLVGDDDELAFADLVSLDGLGALDDSVVTRGRDHLLADRLARLGVERPELGIRALRGHPEGDRDVHQAE